MKKLMILLSVLTITATALPNVIAASKYEKEHSDLDILKRVKRGNGTKKKTTKNKPSTVDEEYNQPSTSTSNTKCSFGCNFGCNKKWKNKKCNQNHDENNKVNPNSLITNKSARERFLSEIKSSSNNIFEDDKQNNKYGFFIRKSIDYFKETKNIVEETTHPETNRKIYKIEKHNVEHSYKKIPIEIDGNKITLILNKSNLYVDGIINYSDDETPKVWFFKDSDLEKTFTSELQKNTIGEKYKTLGKLIDYDPNLSDKKLNDNDFIHFKETIGFDSNYNNLASNKDIKINKEKIKESFIKLSEITKGKQDYLKDHFVRVIFVTSEATRFFSVRKEVNKILTGSNEYEITWENYRDKLTSWDQNSQKYYKFAAMNEKEREQAKSKYIFDENGKPTQTTKPNPTDIYDETKIYDIALLAIKDDEKIRDNDNRKSG